MPIVRAGTHTSDVNPICGDRLAISAIRCCFGNTYIESPGIRRMSQQRVRAPDASLPSPGSARAIVPPFPRYYQGTATSCRPSRRTSFPSLGGTTGARMFRSRHRCVRRRRAWGWSPGIPFREFFRGNDRISQVPGEPQFPFAHVLRPRPADASLTDCGTLAWPPLSERRRHRRR